MGGVTHCWTGVRTWGQPRSPLPLLTRIRTLSVLLTRPWRPRISSEIIYNIIYLHYCPRASPPEEGWSSIKKILFFLPHQKQFLLTKRGRYSFRRSRKASSKELKVSTKCKLYKMWDGLDIYTKIYFPQIQSAFSSVPVCNLQSSRVCLLSICCKTYLNICTSCMVHCIFNIRLLGFCGLLFPKTFSF